MRWSRRAFLAVQRFWQPTSACLACMPGSFTRLTDAVHWAVALQTGLATASLVLLLTLTPATAVFRRPGTNALAVGCLTALGDAYSHLRHDGTAGVESIVTGVVSGLFAFAAAWLLARYGGRLRPWQRGSRRPPGGGRAP